MGEVKQQTHWLKSTCGSWSVETGGRNVEQVVTFIQGFQPERIDQAATAYRDAHTAVNTARTAIEREARKLAEVWEGEASVEAQTALGILYVTLGELADKLNRMHQPLTSLADVVRKHQGFINDGWKGVMPTWHNQMLGSWNDSITDYYSVYTGVYGGDSATGEWGSQDELAGRHLETFGNDLAHVHRMIPDRVEKALRDIRPPQQEQDRPRQVTYPTGPGGPGGSLGDYGGSLGDYGGAGPFTSAAYNGPDLSGPPFTSTNSPNGPAGPGSSNGPAYPGTDSPAAPPPGSPTTPDPSQNPGAPTPPGSAHQPNPTTRLQDYQPPNAGSFPTTSGYGTTPSYTPTTYGGPGTSAGGGGLAAGLTPPAGARGGPGTGMPFMPMGAMGGAGGQESRDRESSTWLHEDDDVWGGDTDPTVNGQIG